jgi:hypothetical protein
MNAVLAKSKKAAGDNQKPILFKRGKATSFDPT